MDDEESVRRVLRLGLRSLGLSVRLAATGPEAVDLYRQHRDAIGVVLLDVHMPAMNGPQTLAALRQIDPQVRAAFMSGDAGNYAVSDLLALGAAAFVPKPLDFAELARTLRQVAG